MMAGLKPCVARPRARRRRVDRRRDGVRERHWHTRVLLLPCRRHAIPLLVLVVGANDSTLPPAQAGQVLAAVKGATLTTLPGLGHLAHEERADLVAHLFAVGPAGLGRWSWCRCSRSRR